MPKKEKIIKVERLAEGSDTHITVEFSANEWALINAYFTENMNQTRAYLKVYPNTPYESAKVKASQFFTKVNVRGEITYRLKEEAMGVEEALRRKAAIARADLRPFIKLGKDGFVYFDMSQSEAMEYLFLVKEMETKRERRIEGKGEDAEEWEGEWVRVKLHDANSALTEILKMHGKFTDKIDVTSKGEAIQPKVDDAGFDRAISSLADALREIVSREDTKPDGALETSK